MMTNEELAAGRILLVNKPLDWSSFDVVKKLRNSLRIKKIGHAGTLDPLATGLMIIGTGKFTKKLNELQGLDKTYEGVIEIGKTTPSYDLETEFDSENSFDHITEEQVLATVRELTGQIRQIPPAYSAVKVGGKRAYKMARNNEKVVLKGRQVNIYSFNAEINLPEITFKVVCSKGTYIRSLAHDLGKMLGTGAYLKNLCRTGIGDYRLKDAKSMDSFARD